MKLKYYIGGLAAAVGGWAAWSVFSTAGIKQPKYRVLEKREGYELRAYEPYIVAETDVSGGFRDALRQGFRRLFDYITGDNTRVAEITMTAPVIERDKNVSGKIEMAAPVMERAAGGVRTIAFVMPPGSSIETLPLPNDADVKLRQVPSRKVAALRFTLNPTGERVEKKKQELLDDVNRDRLQPAGEPEFAGYNPPATIPFLKRNEVLVEVK